MKTPLTDPPSTDKLEELLARVNELDAETAEIRKEWRKVKADLGAEAKRLRKLYGITVMQVSKTSGDHRGVIGQIEQGHAKASVIVAHAQLCKKLHDAIQSALSSET